ncbi:hypothetical protein N9Y91_05320 [Alphaproteobacteria bacterium]|nr:hypothetical protein [Alphaproteobacteria bacterium]
MLPLLTFSAYFKETSREQILTPEIIFHKFPDRSLSSSLGQWRKALSEDKRENFSFSKFPDNQSDKVITRWEECDLTRIWNNPEKDIAQKTVIRTENFFRP